MKSLLVMLAICLTLVGFPAQAWAHQVETNYTLANQLEFQSTFSTGEPFAGATVRIYAPNHPDQPWKTLTTDSQGRFAFLPDVSIPGNWQVKIEDAAKSHGDYWTVPVDSRGTIVEKGIVFAPSRDRPYLAATLVSPTTMALAVGLGWVLYRRGRHHPSR
ncbi:MAG: carboxypeptidase regulatory-like domain-containing protein [Cyanobacteria bacterium REEB459]|nr:carboxypeptidase regulatory-like domain-containing protein [Cyanobacteria bacterium REEB459]